MIKQKSRSLIGACLIAGLTALPSQPALASVTDDLVVHLTFDNTFQDSSGRNNHGTPVGQSEVGEVPPGFVPSVGARLGSHALRIGTGQHVNLGAPEDLQFGADVNFSVGFWIRGAAGAWTSDPSFIANKSWASGSNAGWIIAAQGNGGWKWNFKGSDAPRRDTSNLGVLTDGAWHHILVTHDRQGVASFYLDGRLLTTIPIVDDGDADSFLDLNIGNDGTGRYGFDNDTGARFSEIFMDDVGIWRRALSEGEAAQIYGAGLQGFNLRETQNAAALFRNLTPSPGATAAPALGRIGVQIQEVGAPIALDSIKFRFNGQEVQAATQREGSVVTVSYNPPLLAPGSANTVQIEATTTGANPQTLMQEWAYTVANYINLPAEYARPLGSATAPGFRFRTAWASSTSLPNTIARAEAQLAGTLLEPGTEFPVSNDAVDGPNPDGSYTVPLINFEQAGQNAGNFTGDEPYPGLDAGDINNFSIEAIAYLELPAGYYRFGVNSDDGFQVRAGLPARSVLASTVLGAFDGGRGAADSVFDFVAPVDGIYNFRLIHFEGGGGASVEFFSYDVNTGERTLINDPARPGAIRAFSVLPAVDQLPYVRSANPVPGELSALVDAPITATIVDGSSAVSAGSVKLSLNGVEVNATTARENNVTRVSYQPAPPLNFTTQYTARLVFGAGASAATNSWSFTTRIGDQPPAITGHWDFTQSDLRPTVGYPLEYMSPAIQSQTTYGTTAALGIPGIGGSPASVLRFPGASARDIGYVVRHNAAPNANGGRVNRWTLILDLFFPEANTGSWFSFMQIDNLDNAGDGELFINFSDRTGDGIPDGGIGIGGQYTNQEDFETYIHRGQWHRVAFAVDHSDENDFEQAVISKFIDGKKFADQLRGAGNLDGRHALRDHFLLFADEDGESQLAYVSSVQIRNYKMSDADIAALGGPAAAGIPINVTVINPDLVVESPSLAVARDGSNITISWAASATGFALERTASLSGPVTWETVSGVSNNSITIPASDSARFYRLRR